MKPYRSLATLTKLLVGLVTVILVAALFEGAIAYLWNYRAGDHATWAMYSRIEKLRLELLRPIIWMAMATTFVFVFRAAQNLFAIAPARPTFTPTMSVGWFFVPLANIVMSHQVFTALWRESQSAARNEAHGGVDLSVPLVSVWWALLAAGTLFSLCVQNGQLTEPWQFVARSWVLVAVRLAAGACFIALIRGIARRQDAQHQDLVLRNAIPQPSASFLR